MCLKHTLRWHEGRGEDYKPAISQLAPHRRKDRMGRVHFYFGLLWQTETIMHLLPCGPLVTVVCLGHSQLQQSTHLPSCCAFPFLDVCWHQLQITHVARAFLWVCVYRLTQSSNTFFSVRLSLQISEICSEYGSSVLCVYSQPCLKFLHQKNWNEPTWDMHASSFLGTCQLHRLSALLACSFFVFCGNGENTTPEHWYIGVWSSSPC